MITVKALENEVICKCGGEVMIDAEMTYPVPIGIGFHPDGICYFDTMKYKGWKGVCLDCGEDVFGWTSKRLYSKPLTKKTQLTQAG